MTYLSRTDPTTEEREREREEISTCPSHDQTQPNGWSTPPGAETVIVRYFLITTTVKNGVESSEMEIGWDAPHLYLYLQTDKIKAKKFLQ
jgi:hypothetical protein